MEFLHRRPTAPLSQFVELCWVWQGVQQPHQQERLLPDGATALIVNLREDRSRVYHHESLDQVQTLPGSIVVGAHSRHFVIDTREQLSVAGVQFRPGGAFPFFGLPVGELQDQHVPLQALWGGWAGELRERLLAASGMEARLDVLETAVAARAAWKRERHPAVEFALGEFRRRQRTVGEVTEEIGLSSRRFIEVFRDQVGLTPKLYSRVQRFQGVLRRIRSGCEIDWADLAVDCGYFDQAHFIHDFRAFSGIVPTEYAREDLRHGNHVPIRG